MLFAIAFVFTSGFFSLFSESNTRYSLVFVFGLIIFALKGIEWMGNREAFDVATWRSAAFKLLLTSAVFFIAFFGYQQTIAKNYSFEQLKENSWRKEIGQVNLSAFQKQLQDDDLTIVLTNKKAHDRVSFFLRSDVENIGHITLSLQSGNSSKPIEVNKIDFIELQSDPTVAAAFYDIDISALPSQKLKMSFEGTRVSNPLIVEYVSFY